MPWVTAPTSDGTKFRHLDIHWLAWEKTELKQTPDFLGYQWCVLTSPTRSIGYLLAARL
jgi:hypothetical protein